MDTYRTRKSLAVSSTNRDKPIPPQALHQTSDNMTKDEAAVGMAEQEDMKSIIGFEAMEEDIDIINNNQTEKDLWLDVNEASMFYNDFPPLPPDFPCMSSSSSSSSAPGPTKTTSSSSACSSSWAVLKSDDAAEEDTARRNNNNNFHPIKPATTSMENPMMSDIDCIDVMENFGYMDLIDGNDLWDPSSVFQSENTQDQLVLEPTPPPSQEQDETGAGGGGGGPFSFLQGNSELATIFFEWLKQNKDCISAEDVRSIKLKRSTIESASKRLGSTKEGKKQLLKLILEWVEQYQLQKKRLREGGPQSPYPYQESLPNSSSPITNFTNNLPVPPPDPNTCFNSSPWLPPDAMVGGPPQPAFQPPMVRYGSVDPYTNTMLVPPANQVVNGIPYQHSSEYPMMDHPQGWAQPFPMGTPQYSPFPDNGNILQNHQHAFYGHPYQSFDPNGERLMRLGSSATKEARKKRMARQQRRLYSHHHRHNTNSSQNHGQIDDPTAMEDGGEDGANSPGNWVYWSQGSASANPSTGMIPPVDSSQQQYTGERPPVQPMNCQRLSLSERRQQQGWKTEKNLKFLLQKVLKQSDVGNLGRIVLPKKEAENHLPELESRDGIPIAMEDIGSSRVWNMRYRFWPNNKSRMYLLENTGDFVKVNGLQEGDFIVIYSDTKCGKYMIRGVKVRQPGQKLDCKKGTRRNARNMSFAGNSSSHAPIKQSVR